MHINLGTVNARDKDFLHRYVRFSLGDCVFRTLFGDMPRFDYEILVVACFDTQNKLRALRGTANLWRCIILRFFVRTRRRKARGHLALARWLPGLRPARARGRWPLNLPAACLPPRPLGLNQGAATSSSISSLSEPSTTAQSAAEDLAC